jgi:hypothetical protein
MPEFKHSFSERELADSNWRVPSIAGRGGMSIVYRASDPGRIPHSPRRPHAGSHTNPESWTRMTKHLPLTLFALVCVVAGLGTQLAAAHAAASEAPVAGHSKADPRHVDATEFGERIILGPEWLFAPGDNPAYSSLAFDDSNWRTVSTGKELLDYGIRDIPYAWYRIHIHLRPGTRNLMAGIQDVGGSYEVYANGLLIGARGKMTGQVYSWQDSLVSYAVPDDQLALRGDLVLAIRFALNRGSSMGRGTSTPLQSDSVYLLSRESAPIHASYITAHNAGPPLLLCGLALGACLISFALYFALRSQEYLAIAIYLLASSFVAASLLWLSLNSFSYPALLAPYFVLGVENFALIEFVRLVLRMRRSRRLLALEVVSSLAFFMNPVYRLGIVPTYVFLLTSSLPVLIVKVLLPVLLVRGWRRGNREALLLLPAILLISFADYWRFFRNVADYAHLTALDSYLPFSLPFGSYRLDFYSLGDLAFYIAVLLFLVLRTVRIARERAEAAAEIEAARVVQQVLIPDEIPTVPGFDLHSVYKPAGQVGGDFFQILPIGAGGLLALIGDVSGKGMPAAMTVSLLVGTVHTLAQYTQSPGEILAAMNQRMLVRSRGGFTTCLVLRADLDGTLTMANAGHIAPYLGGQELALENGLPLGVAAETIYAESTFHLAPGQQLALLTDGVVEARDKAGALYGFERTTILSVQPAEAIAHAAEAFGQQDDITVLTLTRLAPAGVSASAPLAPILLPA